MSLEIKVPAAGESITEVLLARWFKKDGDSVELDEIICELESDKATFEVPSEAAGTLKIVAEEGATLEIGAVICEINTDATGSAEPSAPATVTPDESKATGEVHEMTVPTVGESITEVTISTWLKANGDYVEVDEVIAEVDSDKATFELPAEASGLLKIVAQEGDTIDIGALICKIEVMEGGEPAPPACAAENGKAVAVAPAATESSPAAPSGETTYATGHASPAAAKILAEKGIAAVKGTGINGRITKEDAMKAKKPAAKIAEEAPAVIATALPLSAAQAGGTGTSVTAGGRHERRERMSPLRKTVARRLVSVKNETAMLTTFNEVNMKPIMDLRKKYKEKFKEKHEVGLGFMSFFTKAVTMAAMEWPAVNARIDGNEMVYNDFVDVSIAVSAPKGLVVPVIRNAESLSFDQVEREVIRLATKARDNKLSIEEMTGGTFTITNGGIFGSMLSTPIINAPQSAILGMHNIVQRPMAVDGEVKILPIMYVALSYDHRIVDGRESVSFLYRVKELLEDPTRLLLGV